MYNWSESNGKITTTVQKSTIFTWEWNPDPDILRQIEYVNWNKIAMLSKHSMGAVSPLTWMSYVQMDIVASLYTQCEPIISYTIFGKH